MPPVPPSRLPPPQLWKPIFNQAMTALVISQLMVTFLLSVKKVIAPPIIVAVAIPVTIVYW